ncbi:unnamed protein product, partial [Ectocarpus sp. 6 AP-2014]
KRVSSSSARQPCCQPVLFGLQLACLDRWNDPNCCVLQQNNQKSPRRASALEFSTGSSAARSSYCQRRNTNSARILLFFKVHFSQSSPSIPARPAQPWPQR